MQHGAEFAMESAWMGINGSEEKMKGADHSVSFTSSKGADFVVEFTFVPRPMEPNDVDKLVSCPPPEPCIVHDGILFRDRLANSRRRGTDLLGSMRETDHIEYYSTPPSRRRMNRSSQELLQPPALIAPDLVATKIID